MVSKKKFLCLKDWEFESGVYFEKGKEYTGLVSNSGNYVKMYGESGMRFNFHKGSEYFNI